MKKYLILLSVAVLAAAVALSFGSCGGKTASSEDSLAVTAVTDAQGETHYYSPATDKNGDEKTTDGGRVIYNETESESGGKYVTGTATTVFGSSRSKTRTEKHRTAAPKTKTTAPPQTTSAPKADDDNEVTYKDTAEKTTAGETGAAKTTEQSKKSTTAKQSATDSAGWINKWY